MNSRTATHNIIHNRENNRHQDVRDKLVVYFFLDCSNDTHSVHRARSKSGAQYIVTTSSYYRGSLLIVMILSKNILR